MLIVMLCLSYAMSEKPRVLLQRSALQPYMPFSVWPRPSLWAGRWSSGGLWLSRRNPPEPRRHLHLKGRVCVSLLWKYNTTRSGCHRRTTVVSRLFNFTSNIFRFFMKSLWSMLAKVNQSLYIKANTLSFEASVRMETCAAPRIVVKKRFFYHKL